MILFPEIIILNRIAYLMEMLSTEYHQDKFDGKETESALYQMFHDKKGLPIKQGAVDYYKEAVALFTIGKDKRRSIGLRKGWVANKPVEKPIIAVMMASEQASGLGLGYDTQPRSISDTEYADVNSRSFTANYSIWFASQNQDITLIMFKVVRSLIIGNIFMFEDKLQSVSLSANDLSLRPEMAPGSISIRSLSMHFQYQDEGYSFNQKKFVKNINFDFNVYYEGSLDVGH